MFYKICVCSVDSRIKGLSGETRQKENIVFLKGILNFCTFTGFSKFQGRGGRDTDIHENGKCTFQLP